MKIEVLLAGAAIGVATVLAYNARQRVEENMRCEPLKPGWKSCLIEPLMLPVTLAVVLLVLLVMALVPDRWNGSALLLVAAWLGQVALHISAYYLLLLLLLPGLRRIFSARACATLWLLPTLLYFTFQMGLNEWGIQAQIAIPLPRRYLLPALALWVCGVLGVMSWQILSHFRLRRFLVGTGTKLEDPDLLRQWHMESRRHGVKREIPILISEAVATPLTIGCFDETMYLVLPGVAYTPEERELIFRHELRHILRCDSRTKVFLGFCAALCWFNPLGWLACRKAAEDLELSCDEAVLAGADGETRKQYAQLLLKSAGTGRGYTTCLSAAAGTLRYRLRSVMKPARRLAGGVAVGSVLFLLIATFGVEALVDSPASAKSLVFDQVPQGSVLDRVRVESWNQPGEHYREVYGYQAQAITDYLSSLTLRQVYAGHYEMGDGRQIWLDYTQQVEGETVSRTTIDLSDSLLVARIPFDNQGELTYLVEGGVDWAYLDSLLDFEAPDPDPPVLRPELKLYLRGPQGEEEGPLHAQYRVWSITDAQGTRVPEYEDSGIGGSFGQTLTQVELEFTVPPSGGYTVTVERWDGSEAYTVSSTELEGNVLPLAPYSAHYTVWGEFPVGEALYEIEFYFDIGQPVDQEVWQYP